ncbi:ATP synthase F1 subunit epsilon [Treponema sp. R80B11-R83G3]
MPALFNFEVHTPRRLFYSGKVEAITLVLEDGEIGIYANHSPFTALSVTGILRIKDDNGNWRAAFVSSGVLEVKEHKNVLMADNAEWPEEIDKERALESKQQAEEALKNVKLKFNIGKAKEELRRAECRLKILEAEKK